MHYYLRTYLSLCPLASRFGPNSMYGRNQLTSLCIRFKDFNSVSVMEENSCFSVGAEFAGPENDGSQNNNSKPENAGRGKWRTDLHGTSKVANNDIV